MSEKAWEVSWNQGPRARLEHADSTATFDYRVRETVPMMLSEVYNFSNVSFTRRQAYE